MDASAQLYATASYHLKDKVAFSLGLDIAANFLTHVGRGGLFPKADRIETRFANESSLSGLVKVDYWINKQLFCGVQYTINTRNNMEFQYVDDNGNETNQESYRLNSLQFHVGINLNKNNLRLEDLRFFWNKDK